MRVARKIFTGRASLNGSVRAKKKGIQQPKFYGQTSFCRIFLKETFGGSTLTTHGKINERPPVKETNTDACVHKEWGRGPQGSDSKDTRPPAIPVQKATGLSSVDELGYRSRDRLVIPELFPWHRLILLPSGGE